MNSNTTPRVARRITSPAVAPPGIPLPTDDAPTPVHHYCTPPSRSLASCEWQRSSEVSAFALAVDISFHNIVTMTSGHGGMGLSIMVSMPTWTLARREHSCTLIDADLVAGCPDLLLGAEREPDLRFSQVDAPLDRIEGDAMNHELMMWGGVRVPPYDLWSACQPDWWGVRAATRALAETNDIAIVDAGQGGFIEIVPDLRSGMQVIVAESSAMGLARAKSYRSRLGSWGCEAPHIVGVEPRGAPRGGGRVGIGEVQDYLTATVLGPVKPSVNLCGGVLEGLGIRLATKGSRKVVSLPADLIEQAIRLVSGASCKDW